MQKPSDDEYIQIILKRSREIMNLVSSMIGLSVMGIVAPTIMDISIAPVIAQKRSNNFGIAASAAVVFAATYEGTTDIPQNTDTLVAAEREDTQNAYSVTCTYGADKFVAYVTRAFRLAVPDQDLVNGNGADETRVYANPKPNRFSGHQCPPSDPWGVNGYNDQYYKALNGACTPQDAWNQVKYQFSDQMPGYMTSTITTDGVVTLIIKASSERLFY